MLPSCAAGWVDDPGGGFPTSWPLDCDRPEGPLSSVNRWPAYLTPSAAQPCSPRCGIPRSKAHTARRLLQASSHPSVLRQRPQPCHGSTLVLQVAMYYSSVTIGSTV